MIEELYMVACLRYRKAEGRVDHALRLLRKHDESATITCKGEECGCVDLDLEELIENLKDDHAKATGELRRLKKAVANAGLDIGYTVDGGTVLMRKGVVL